jgi:hypothetical protein
MKTWTMSTGVGTSSPADEEECVDQELELPEPEGQSGNLLPRSCWTASELLKSGQLQT